MGHWYVQLGDVGTWLGGIGSAAAALAAFRASRSASAIATADRRAASDRERRDHERDRLEGLLDYLRDTLLAFEDSAAHDGHLSAQEARNALNRADALAIAAPVRIPYVREALTNVTLPQMTIEGIPDTFEIPASGSAQDRVRAVIRAHMQKAREDLDALAVLNLTM
jgi:hypothetical protein